MPATLPKRLMLMLALLVLPAATAWAEPADEPRAPVAKDAGTDEQPTASPLSTGQRQVGERFRELEKLLLRMAELTAPTDPRRAALLRQAVAQSNDRDIDHKFEQLVELLKNDRFSAAVKSQGAVRDDLQKLLELLLSEDRSKRLESEKERVREYLKRVNKIIKDQKSLQGETAREGDARKLADRQSDLAEKTGELADDLGSPSGQQTEDAKSADPKENKDGTPDGQPAPDKKTPPQPGEEKSGDSPAKKSEPSGDASDKGDGQPGDQDPKKKPRPENNPDETKKSRDKAKPEERAKPEGRDGPRDQDQPHKPDAKPGDEQGAPKGESQPETPGGQNPAPPPPGEQEQNSGQGGQGEPPNENPAEKRLQKARERMKQAQQKLEEAQHHDASEAQREALQELEQAKAELEEILRQLREEEMARTLAMLESRFRKMLDAEMEVYEGTKRLDHVAQTERDRDDEIESGRLSRKQTTVATEADRALEVLKEEGSAVALPEAVMEMRDDMNQVARYLSQSKVGELTQSVEKDIIAALEEMITALKKAQKDMEDKSKQGEPAEGGDMEPPLVDTLAELKMIRALQMRVNVRTQHYAEMTKTEQTDTPELLQALAQLAARERRIHKVTRDIVVGRNR